MLGVHLPPPREPVPSAIVRRAIGGDPFAEEELVGLFGPGLLSHLTRRVHDREAARELVNDVLMVMVRAVREHRVKDPERLAGFVYGTARNLANNYLRTLHGHPQPEPLRAELAVRETGEGFEHGEQLALLRDGLDALHDVERQIVLMTLEGLKPGKIADSLGLSHDVVRARKSRAIRKLARSLGTPATRAIPASLAVRLRPRTGSADRRRRLWRIR